jgi:magnesium transporter
LTISAYVLDKHSIKQTDFSNPIAIREEMVQNPEESLWIHGDEPEDVFPLQTIFGLHPLSVEAVTHQNQPSKIEEYDEYLFTIIDGVRYDEKEQEQQQTANNKIEDDKYNLNLRLIEDDLYIFFERRWIITINFHNQKFQENVRRRTKNLQQQVMKTLESKLQPPGNKNDRKSQMTPQMCEVIYRLAIEESIASYYPIVDKTNKQLEQIEESILNASISKTQLSNIISLRRKISFLEGTLGMVSRAFDDIIRSGGGILEQTKLSRDSRRQIRSLNDKVTYLRRDIENMHQRVIGLREAYNSSLTANLNETIRTLTVIATIVLPLTLISGIYGMNFDVMPELRSPYGYYFALSLMAAVGGGMIGYFKRKRWI